MPALTRKMIRDLLQMKGQVTAICLVMACGVAAFVTSLSTLDSLTRAMETYYEHYRFADVFAHLKRAPLALRDRVAEIPGVAFVQTRVSENVILDMPDLEEPAVGLLISVPAEGDPGLNDLYLRRGRLLEPGRYREVLVSEAFALAHELEPGDTVAAVMNGRFERLTVVGIVLSPEYVYQIRPGDVLPDNKRFGVFWMSEKELAAAFDMDGAFNDLTLTLMPGAVEAEVIARLDRLTERYGGLGAHGREDQISHKFVSNEIKELRGMTIIVPMIFLGVAAFLLNVVLTRLIDTQREQIAALKAVGYTRFEIGVHFLQMVLVIVLAAVAIGTAAGAWMGSGLTEMYTAFFHFPVFGYHLDPADVALAGLVSAAAGIVGTRNAVRRAVRLPPAEAMRPAPPAEFRPTVFERAGLQHLLSPAARMILRQLERRPMKALLSCFGISLAVAILVVGDFMEDAVDYIMDLEFHRAQRYDLSVTFVDPAPAPALNAIRSLPGVLHCEPFRALPARLTFGHRSRRVGITGVRPEGELFHLIDLDGRRLTLPRTGIVLSEKLAELLEVRVGEMLTVEVLEERRPIVRVPVTGVITIYAGLGAYMHIDAANALMREEDVSSGAYVAADPARLDALYRTLKETPEVAGVTASGAMVEAFRETIAESLLRMKQFNVTFAVIIAFGVVYNSARISLSERSRELATLRVIGFTRAEISAIQLGELATLTVLAVPGGLVLGYFLAALATKAYDTELFRMPLVIDRSTYGFAAAVVTGAAVASGLVVRRLLDRLDLVAVLKMKE